MEANKALYIRGGLVGGALILTYFLATSVVPKVLVTFTKAAPASIISLSESRVLGEKILAKADGIDKNVVNIYILDKDGKGVKGKLVSMEGMAGITPSGIATDADGKAKFSMTSKVEGQFTLTASVGGSPLNREIKVTFRND